MFVHAVASPYRERSHFDGQNILETGGEAAYKLQDGWMNRLLGLLPPADARAIAGSESVVEPDRGIAESDNRRPLLRGGFSQSGTLVPHFFHRLQRRGIPG